MRLAWLSPCSQSSVNTPKCPWAPAALCQDGCGVSTLFSGVPRAWSSTSPQKAFPCLVVSTLLRVRCCGLILSAQVSVSWFFSLHELVSHEDILLLPVPSLMPEMAPCGAMTQQKTSLSLDAGRAAPSLSSLAGAHGLCLPCTAVKVFTQLSGLAWRLYLSAGVGKPCPCEF